MDDASLKSLRGRFLDTASSLLFRAADMSMLIWGARGERYFLSAINKLSPKKSAQLIRIERGGLCPTFGAPFVHLMADFVIPIAAVALTKVISGYDLDGHCASCFVMPVVIAMGSSPFPLSPHKVRASGSAPAAVRRRQLKIYFASLAASLVISLTNAALAAKRHEYTITPSQTSITTKYDTIKERAASYIVVASQELASRPALIAYSRHEASALARRQVRP